MKIGFVCLLSGLFCVCAIICNCMAFSPHWEHWDWEFWLMPIEGNGSKESERKKGALSFFESHLKRHNKQKPDLRRLFIRAMSFFTPNANAYFFFLRILTIRKPFCSSIVLIFFWFCFVFVKYIRRLWIGPFALYNLNSHPQRDITRITLVNGAQFCVAQQFSWNGARKSKWMRLGRIIIIINVWLLGVCCYPPPGRFFIYPAQLNRIYIYI